MDANFSGATLVGSDLREAQFLGSNFTGADLSGAVLTDAQILGTIFTDAIMQHTRMRSTPRPRAACSAAPT